MATGLGSLEIELLSLILEFVVDNSPTSTKFLALVNNNFYSTTKLIGHRSKTIEYGADRGEAGQGTDLVPWFRDNDLLRGVRYITVESSRSNRRGGHHDTEDQDREALEIAKYGDLITLITKLGNLRTLIWSYSDPMPVRVLEALHEHHKKADLRVTWNRWDITTDHADPSESALAKSPALSSIRAQIWVSTIPKEAHKSAETSQAESILRESTGLPMAQVPSMLTKSRSIVVSISRNANICAS